MFSLRQYWKKHNLTILGLILMAIAAIYAALTYHFPLKQTPEIKTSEPQGDNKEKNNVHKFPPLTNQDSPDKIMAEIESVPPLQRDDIAKAYIGIPVNWDLYFIGGSLYKDEYRLSFGSSLKPSKTYIRCYLPRENNEYLRRLPEKTKIHVQGNIDKIDVLAIYLKNVTITPM